jgi:hypothetical protein
MIDLIELGIGGSQAKYIAYKPQKDEWEYNDGEPTMDAFLLDPNSLKVGWGKITRGAPPEYKWRENITIPETAPGETGTDGWNVAMSLEIYLKDEGMFAWTTTAKGPIQGMHAIYSQVMALASSNEGKIPCLKYTGSEETSWKSRIPQFEVLKWADKPADWNEAPAQEEAPEPEAEESNEDIPF